MSLPVRPSVCLSSVTFVRCTQAIENFSNVSTPFGTLAICDLSVKILRRSSYTNPHPAVDIIALLYKPNLRNYTSTAPTSVGRGVAEYSNFGPIERYISETVQDRS